MSLLLAAAAAKAAAPAVVTKADVRKKQAAAASIETHAQRARGALGQVWAFAETALREKALRRRARRLRRAAGVQGRARRGGHADGVRRDLRFEGAPIIGDHGRVRRAARALAEGDCREAAARRRGGRPRLRPQPLRRGEPRAPRSPSRSRSPPASCGARSASTERPRRKRSAERLHGARRPVRRSRRGARLAPGRRDGSRHGLAARRSSTCCIEFHGKAAHAASDPWNGRSAVDAAELFTHGVNMMREHVKPTSASIT